MVIFVPMDTLCIWCNFRKKRRTAVSERERARIGMASSCKGARRIVALAVDDSDHSDYAFEYYCEKVMREGDKLIMIHVPEDCSFMTGAEEKVRHMKAQATKMDVLEKKYMDKLVMKRIEGVFRVGVGKPGPVIVRLSREENADLVVVGTRGQSKARQLIVGSVSKYVIYHSAVPVLLCRREDPSVGVPAEQRAGSLECSELESP